MASPEIKNKNITSKEFDNLTRSYELDYEALFDVVMDEVNTILEGADSGVTFDQLVNEIDEVLGQ
jgi:hypothetical protein